MCVGVCEETKAELTRELIAKTMHSETETKRESEQERKRETT